MQRSTHTPDRPTITGNQRRHTTPPLSTQAWEESRVEDSGFAITPASIAKEHFGYLGWKWRGKHFGSKLPLCLFLKLHDRGHGHKIGTGADVLRWVVSGTIVRAIREVRANRETRGEPPDLALGCYEGLAVHLNDFVDIFNGEETKCGLTRKRRHTCNIESKSPGRGVKLKVAAINSYVPFTRSDHFAVHTGDYGRTKFERRAQINKMKGYVTSADDPILERLVEILRYFDDWNDMMQIILEHRFKDVRAGLGTLRNPTAAQAKERSVRGDLNRGLHGGSRANFNRNARSGNDFIDSDYRSRIMLAVTQAEAAENVRARSRNSPNAVLCPRYISVEPLAAAPVVEAPVPAAQGSSTIVNPYASSK
ncbi:unnamed protein product [Ectocarpus sp. CCAP 1310/34]|nr:unnamed protein product [Ectocarpus sp. CCAP 1310/34]